jgi:aspartyl-tRNA(Asn)/glutamyl-tRNA(Gln) amidotransferase subunit B
VAVENYLVDIGLEVHVELATHSKMFCGCPVVDTAHAKPNSAVCPICMGLPGTLPVINKKAVEFAIRAASALGCEISGSSIFARKNYFYPDLPKGYQISQYELPLAVNGQLPITTNAGQKNIRIHRVHLEEDTGKLTHITRDGESYSLVDLNRCGVPLLEIVSEPDMHSVEDVRAYSTSLRSLLRYIGITSGDMEKGAMRFEANISLRPLGRDELGTRVEIKNLNSFSAMEQAMIYQIEYQYQLLLRGEKVKQQTLGWNETRGITQPQRSKEEANDYRYFPEPDLPPLLLDKGWINQIISQLPELPSAKALRFKTQYQLSDYDILRLIEDKPVADYFEACLQADTQIPPKTVANWIIGELFGWLKDHDEEIQHIKVSSQRLMELLTLLDQGKINQNTATVVLNEMLSNGLSARDIVTKHGLEQVSDVEFIHGLIQKMIDDHPTEVESYLKGKETIVNWFFGQVMQAAKGKANPAAVKLELEKTFSKLKQR